MRLHRKHGYERQRPAKSVLRVTLRERDKELKISVGACALIGGSSPGIQRRISNDNLNLKRPGVTVQRHPEHAQNAHSRVQAANEARADHGKGQRRAERATNCRPFNRIVITISRVKNAAVWIDNHMQLQRGPNDPKIENPSALVRLQLWGDDREKQADIRNRCKNKWHSSIHEMKVTPRGVG